jgi:hypothetical protein
MMHSEKERKGKKLVLEDQKRRISISEGVEDIISRFI